MTYSLFLLWGWVVWPETIVRIIYLFLVCEKEEKNTDGDMEENQLW